MVLLFASLNAKLAIIAEKLLQIIIVSGGTKVTHEIFEFYTGRLKVFVMPASESIIKFGKGNGLEKRGSRFWKSTELVSELIERLLKVFYGTSLLKIWNLNKCSGGARLRRKPAFMIHLLVH